MYRAPGYAPTAMRERDLTVVTGGSAGIGLALARRLERPHGQLLLVARGAERLAAAGRELHCETLVADLATEAGVSVLAARLSEAPRIRLLINNAGGPFRTPLLEHHPDEAARAIDLLYLAMVRVTAAAWPGLVAARGSIVNVVSDATGTGPVLVSGIRFDSGWAAAGAASDILRLTPAVAATAPASRPAAAAASTATGGNGASNSGALTGGQFLDGGMGQIGLQWQQVTIDCPIRIVNNVLSVTVSGTNTRGVVVQDVTFV